MDCVPYALCHLPDCLHSSCLSFCDVPPPSLVPPSLHLSLNWNRLGALLISQALRVWRPHVDFWHPPQEQQLLLELRDRALDIMSEGIWIADTNGSLLYANHGFSAISGYPVHEIIGQPWSFNKASSCACYCNRQWTNCLGSALRQ